MTKVNVTFAIGLDAYAGVLDACSAFSFTGAPTPSAGAIGAADTGFLACDMTDDTWAAFRALS